MICCTHNTIIDLSFIIIIKQKITKLCKWVAVRFCVFFFLKK